MIREVFNKFTRQKSKKIKKKSIKLKCISIVWVKLCNDANTHSKMSNFGFQKNG